MSNYLYLGVFEISTRVYISLDIAVWSQSPKQDPFDLNIAIFSSFFYKCINSDIDFNLGAMIRVYF